MDDNPTTYEDEITIKELIVKCKEYIQEIWKFWWIVGIFILCGVVGFYYLHNKHIPKYKSELRFVVEGQSGSGGGLSNLLGSFGIKKGGKVNPFKILEVGKSTHLLLNALSKPANENVSIANSILMEYDLAKIWGSTDPDYLEFTFGEVISIKSLPLERKAIKKIRKLIWGTSNSPGITNLKLDEDTGIYSLTTETLTEELSLEITKALYYEIKLFFEEEVFSNQKQLADILTTKADSLKNLNESKIRQLAVFEDRNRGAINNQSLVTRRILSQESLALTTAYAEIMKNKEMTDVNLQDMQPLFMSIDYPFGPLAPTASSLLFSLIKGIGLGLFLSTILILIRKIYQDVMSN